MALPASFAQPELGATIRVARRNIAKLLRRSPSLRRGLSASLDEVYPNARIRAAVATRLLDDALPDACPCTPDQVTGDWMP
jgi:Domain of unknown function DUF29